MERRGSGAAARGPSLIALTGGPKTGKTRFAASCCRGDEAQYGKRAVYVAIDPEADSLGSVMMADRDNMEVVTLNPKKDLFSELKGVYTFDWAKEGISTVITDTMTIWSQDMLALITNSGRFSDKHIALSPEDKVFQPMPGDFLGVETLLFSLLRFQKLSGMNHITLFHEREDRPEPGTAGDPIGGPATVGKASIRKIAAWYNTVLRLEVRPKKRTDLKAPQEYERILHTAPHGIWSAGLRTPHATNPVPMIPLGDDPVNGWEVLAKTLRGDQ